MTYAPMVKRGYSCLTQADQIVSSLLLSFLSFISRRLFSLLVHLLGLYIELSFVQPMASIPVVEHRKASLHYHAAKFRDSGFELIFLEKESGGVPAWTTEKRRFPGRISGVMIAFAVAPTEGQYLKSYRGTVEVCIHPPSESQLKALALALADPSETIRSAKFIPWRCFLKSAAGSVSTQSLSYMTFGFLTDSGQSGTSSPQQTAGGAVLGNTEDGRVGRSLSRHTGKSNATSTCGSDRCSAHSRSKSFNGFRRPKQAEMHLVTREKGVEGELFVPTAKPRFISLTFFIHIAMVWCSSRICSMHSGKCTTFIT